MAEDACSGACPVWDSPTDPLRGPAERFYPSLYIRRRSSTSYRAASIYAGTLDGSPHSPELPAIIRNSCFANFTLSNCVVRTRFARRKTLTSGLAIAAMTDAEAVRDTN